MLLENANLFTQILNRSLLFSIYPTGEANKDETTFT